MVELTMHDVTSVQVRKRVIPPERQSINIGRNVYILYVIARNEKGEKVKLTMFTEAPMDIEVPDAYVED